MKRLDKLLLINWHYIVHDLLELEMVTFLTGKNSAGKSTILDALQMLVLGDTSGHFFNKAANDNSRRSLKGYLYAEVGEAEDSGIVYLRANQTFSSYVVAEFTDTVKKQQFCMGIVFDCHPDGTVNHRFFTLLDELPGFHFIREGTPLGIQELRQWGARLGKGKFELYETNKRYQDMFRSHMGNIGEKFFRLFRKAVPFTPIMDIAGFISEFVCDVDHRLDIEDMRENIRHYRRLEADLGYVQRKVTALREIGQQGEALAGVDERLRVNQYVVDRAQTEELRASVQRLMEELGATEAKRLEFTHRLATVDSTLTGLRQQRDAWREEQARSDVYATKQRIESEKQLLEAEFAGLMQSVVRQERIVQELSARWSAVADGVKRGTTDWLGSKAVGVDAAGGSGVDGFGVDGGIESSAPGRRQLETVGAALQQAYRELRGAVGRIRSPIHLAGVHLAHFPVDQCIVDVSQFKEVSDSLTNVAHNLQIVHRSLQGLVDDWRDEQRTLETVITELEKGIKPYDARVTTLQRAIADDLLHQTGELVPVTIFAEALDIPNDTWQQAIEGYLHTQRFYLLVPPAHYEAALNVYQTVKRAQRIFDVGLVDIQPIMDKRPERMAGSLAEEIETKDPFARAYADFLLGRVVKCDDVQALRRHRTAITPDGMLYQGFVVRQLDPRRWENLFIGKRALAQQLEQKRTRLNVVRIALETWGPRAQLAVQWAKVAPPTDRDAQDVAEAQAALQVVPGMQQTLAEKLEVLGSLDLSWLLELEGKIKDGERQIGQAEQQREGLLRDRSGADWQLKDLQSERIPQAERVLQESVGRVREKYEEKFVKATAEPRFQQELERLKSPLTVLANFGRQLQADGTRRDGLWTELVSLRANYNRDFQAGFDIQRPDNDAFAAELQRFIDSQLTEYEEKIRQAKERAQVQFQEDFISKLQSNIYTVEGQIKELNVALRGISFGKDQYRFQVLPSQQYIRFYEMIMDELLMEGYGLFSQTFQDKHGDVVEELFRNIVDVNEADALAMTELEKNLEKFTDYRTYLNFDLIVKDGEGRESRLSRVIAKKSGGETQTPFYISVLASFVQLYRVGRTGSDNTLRLIVFDEAYSKMDHQRIRESVRLIRDLGLQIILSAPTEKLADISPIVDRTVIVTRIASQTKVLAFEVDETAVNG